MRAFSLFLQISEGVTRARASKPRETRAASIHARGHFSISCVSLDGLRKKGRLLVVHNILCHLSKDCATKGKNRPSHSFFSNFDKEKYANVYRHCGKTRLKITRIINFKCDTSETREDMAIESQ